MFRIVGHAGPAENGNTGNTGNRQLRGASSAQAGAFSTV